MRGGGVRREGSVAIECVNSSVPINTNLYQRDFMSCLTIYILTWRLIEGSSLISMIQVEHSSLYIKAISVT